MLDRDSINFVTQAVRKPNHEFVSSPAIKILMTHHFLQGEQRPAALLAFEKKLVWLLRQIEPEHWATQLRGWVHRCSRDKDAFMLVVLLVVWRGRKHPG